MPFSILHMPAIEENRDGLGRVGCGLGGCLLSVTRQLRGGPAGWASRTPTEHLQQRNFLGSKDKENTDACF